MPELQQRIRGNTRMNKREIRLKRNDTARKYFIPGCAETLKRPRQAIYPNPGNTPEHERMKGDVCFELAKAGHEYITEANRAGGKVRVDIVDLDSGYEIEIVCKHDDPKVIQRYIDEGVVIVYTDKPILKQIIDVFAHE